MSSRKIPKLFHLSFNRKLPKILKPRLPWGTEKQTKTDHIYNEFDTPRVSFSPTLAHCVQAVYPNTQHLFQSRRGRIEGLEFAIYAYDHSSDSRVMFPNDLKKERAVWDAHITKEYCFLDPVKIYFCGTVVVRVPSKLKGVVIFPFDDLSMKKIVSDIPSHDEISFRQTLRLEGDKFKPRFY